MEATSQVILRNLRHLSAEPALLVDAPRDALDASLAAVGVESRHSCQDFATFRYFRKAGMEAAFEPVPGLQGGERLLLLHLPREKERLAMSLHAIASRMNPDGRLWLVGENREGIRSAGAQLERRFGRVSVLDKARHCVLYQAEGPLNADTFSLDDYAQWWSVAHAGREVWLCSLPGVFAHGRLDAGTRLLLEALNPLRPDGRLLDFACGSGVVGLALTATAETARPTLLDASALALESARRSLERNGFEGRLLPSDGCSELSGRFDWIVSNPPFHRGVRNDLEVAAAFFREAANHLDESGRIAVVFNRHLPYVRWMREAFAGVEVLADDGRYLVVAAQAPRSGRRQRSA